MKYLSVCSGIEAASVAWHPLGFNPVGFSEIDKFPATVLAARFPNVKNYGDMNGFKSWNLETIDILVGGTPCQSFSVAGLRKGMADPRGNLAIVYCGILERFRPQWFIWENVPGVLSSNGGRDFGSFLGAVAKLGYGFAYRVLDAQYFGVPQRRRRVFVVGHLGDWRRSAAVLFERESLLGNPTKGRSKEQEVTKTLRGRANSSHREDSDNFVAHACLAKGGTGRLDPSCETFVPCTLTASDGGVSSGMHPIVPCGVTIHGTDKTSRIMSYTDISGSLRTKPPGSIENSSTTAVLTGTLKAHHSVNGNPENVIAFDCRAGGESGLSIDEIPGALRCHDGGHAAIVIGSRARGDDGRGYARPEHMGPIAGTVDATKPERVLTLQMQVRRLTPRECERLQGFQDDFTAIEYRGKPACDGPRYKAIGNSMAVPVMRWIGERILLTR